MSNILVINASGQETRVALIEQGTISEYYLERKNEKGIVGNIYKGRVVRVLPGMQAAFVDIGLDKAAFLYVGDIVSDPTFPGFSEEMDIKAGAVEGDPLEADDLPEPSDEPLPQAAESPPSVAEVAAVPEPAQEAPAPATQEPAEVATPSPEPVPAEAAAGAQTAEPADIVDLHPDDALDDEEEDDDEELDEADAAHAAAEEVLAAEQAKASEPPPGGEPAAEAAQQQAATPPPEAGARGLPAEQRPAAREGRRGRRRGGRGRRRGGESARPEQPKGERRQENGKPWQSQERRGGNGDKRNGNGKHRAQIQDLLKEGDEVLVQVVKDPIGTKGARITCHISLPGRHLVFMPTVDHVGISRRIENEKERRRLRELVDRYRPPGTGFIVRTVAENEPSEKLTADIKFLLGLWNEVGKKRESMKAPACVHPDLDLILRSIRDLFSDEVEKLVIDDRSEFERVRAFVEQAAPELKERIELYGGEEPIFDEFGIEQELVRAQNRKVWLKSGGYIIIDQTEALVAIDVNSGRYVGKKGAGASLEDTITKINCEAAKEIVYQLRLRNIGGIIIIDFIDMDKGANREKVFKTLQEALAVDRAKTNVLKISDIGLVEMTRKRVRESITRLTTEICPTCDGRGHVRSKTTMAYDIMREVQRAAGKHREDQLVVSCHPDVAKLLQGPEREAMRLLMMKLNKSITVRPQPQYHLEQYDLHAKWSRPDLQQAQRGQGRRDGGRREGNRGSQTRPDQPAAAEARSQEPPAVKVGD
ncbi:MAG: Rne/Rng family ribonuclease [Deltaproteobacteria bacterium]|nr:MAG: Rne/Rng family ribonuclease [Deltaproteobacteria bacterium]TMB36679.1 MAG: Rne/Rng family ribonuclease [Deltaproteobacteria bacterium]